VDYLPQSALQDYYETQIDDSEEVIVYDAPHPTTERINRMNIDYPNYAATDDDYYGHYYTPCLKAAE
jgi:hypothetical protein